MRRPAIPVLALLAALAACTGNPASPPPPSRAVTSLTLPFDAYTFTPTEEQVFGAAQDELTARCMNDRGLDWEVIDRPARVPNDTNRRRYGVIEKPVAARYGYHVPDELLDLAGVSKQIQQREAGLSPEQSAAAMHPDKGCEREAYEMLTASGDPSFNKLNDLSSAAFEQAQRTPATSQAMDAWSACMKTRGHRYKDPFEAIGDKRWKVGDPTTTASRAETAAAGDDVACKTKTGLIGIWNAEETRLQNRAIKDHPRYFATLAKAKKQQLEAARAVLQQDR